MAGTKKPRRKYRPKGLDGIGSFARVLNNSHVMREVNAEFYQPLNADDQRDVAIAFGASLDAIVNGKGTVEHIRILAEMCNLALVLCTRGHGPQYEKDVVAALDAVFRANICFKRRGTWQFDEVGRAALQRAFDVVCAQAEVAGQGELIAAGVEVGRRVKEGNLYREAA
jgi:hypothetical protein